MNSNSASRCSGATQSATVPQTAGSGKSGFEQPGSPALPGPLAGGQPYVYAEWKEARVHIDDHVELRWAITTRAAPTNW